MEPLVQLLADLVAIPSMNPMGRNRSGPHYSEAAIAEYIAQYLRTRGADVVVSEVAPGRPNVIGSIDVGAPLTMLLEAHLDTVHADSMEVAPFEPLVREDRLYGRGACDTKASLAAFVFSACAALARPSELRHNLVLAAVADEEYRFTGALHAVRTGLRADYGIAGEPTQLRIVRAHKGVTRWRICAEGRAAHSAYPERGENAIYRMGHVIVRMEQYAKQLQAMASYGELGTPTASVGVVEGGQAVNIVPDSCWIEVDRRTIPTEQSGEMLAHVRNLLSDIPGVSVEPPYIDVPGMDVPPEAPIVQLLHGGVAMVLGEARMESANYATDAGVYTSHGIPTVVFGPGSISQAHTSNEFVELEQVRQTVEILRRIL